MKIDHIQIAIPVGKEGEARKFFIDILDMTEEEKPEPLASRGGCWFRKGNLVVHIGVEKQFRPQLKAHCALIVNDIYSLEKKLIANNYEIKWDNAIPNILRFYTSDPFGNRIEFIKNGDGFSQK